MSNTLVFAVNGKKQEVVNPDPGLTLANYLRQNGYTGTKIGCGEGGCGACIVMVVPRFSEVLTTETTDRSDPSRNPPHKPLLDPVGNRPPDEFSRGNL